ncbi:Protein phosphatase PP2A regulatory subunit B [Cryptotrichosporon argae]
MALQDQPVASREQLVLKLPSAGDVVKAKLTAGIDERTRVVASSAFKTPRNRSKPLSYVVESNPYEPNLVTNQDAQNMSDAAAAASPTPATNGATSPAPAAAAPVAAAPAAAAPAAAAPAAAPASGAPAASGTSASLYVGELEPAVTEAMLFEIFNMVGPVASIRVCRDAVTRRSLGYAYVNYINAADGERALEHLNYSLIKGRPCRIMWSQRDPALRKTGQGNIFIKNLADDIDNKALHDTFIAFGNILSCKVATDETGKSRGFAFVHYETGEAADTAIQQVNGMLLNDRKVFVGHHVSKKERQSKVEEQRAQFTNVFVKNLDLEVTQQELEDMFKPFGDIVSAALGTDETGASKGFAFVNFTTHEAARKAADELNDKEIKGKKLYVGRAQKRTERDDELRKVHEERRVEQESKTAGVNLYVKNIDDEWDDDRLRTEFDFAGTITSAKIMRDEKGASRGFGFVCFSSPEEATRAVSEMNGKMIGTKPLYVALAQKKDVRRQALESQAQQRSAQRLQYAAANGMGGPQAYMQAPMYYPTVGPYGQPMLPPRGPGGVMGYPGVPVPRPGGPVGRYPPTAGQPGAPVPMGYPPVAGYPGVPPYPVRPAGNARPPTAAPSSGPRPNGTSPLGAQQGLPPASRGQAARPPYDVIPGTRINAQMLARAPPADQKQLLGEALYPLIHATEGERAGKITGMLLEMDNAELLHLVESPAALQEKVDEAIRVLAEWGKSEDVSAAPAEAAEAKEEKAE